MYLVYVTQTVREREQDWDEAFAGIPAPSHLEWRLVARLADDDAKGLMALQQRYKALKVKRVPDTKVGFDAIKGDLEPPRY